ncbi:cysteine-rich RECEPTOR-like kinase [Actinidia rufa]|uniref:Cysteine-rich RECEPTOR-like kinase n=1 Tax=Actinidia rufa TaxID=165716 RepID=A0A7J0DBT0_9ERIC|nr:cysteine-rich RECEPTOR-like kinase [Actinidia rufa]
MEWFFENDEVYYTYELLNSSVVSRFILNPNGVARCRTWIDRTEGWVIYLAVPQDSCETYQLCGSYGSCNIDKSPVCGCLGKFVPKYPNDWNATDWSGGCIRRTQMVCQNGDGFLKYTGIKMPDTRNSWFNRTMNLKECSEGMLEGGQEVAVKWLSENSRQGLDEFKNEVICIAKLQQ